MTKAVNLPADALIMGLTHGIRDDFAVRDTGIWTAVLTDSGTATVVDAVGGILPIIPSDGTVLDNDEAYVATKELFKIASGKPMQMVARVQFTEANTDDVNIFAGFMDAMIANSLIDDGGGPKASFSGAGFYKVDGGTRWQVIYSNGSSQRKEDLSATNALTKTAQTAGGATYQTIEVDIIPLNATQCTVIFKIDGKTVFKMNDMLYSSATEVSVGFGIKNGGITVVETLNVDYVHAYQKR